MGTVYDSQTRRPPPKVTQARGMAIWVISVAGCILANMETLHLDGPAGAGKSAIAQKSLRRIQGGKDWQRSVSSFGGRYLEIQLHHDPLPSPMGSPVLIQQAIDDPCILHKALDV